MRKTCFALASVVLCCAVVFAAPAKKNRVRLGVVLRGDASFHERTNRLVTAAHGVHRGARIQVKCPNQKWSKAIIVTVNDAGPYVKGRVLDLSTGAFKRLYPLSQGHGAIHYRVVRDGKGQWTGRLR